MFVSVTVYKDQFGIYPDGATRVIQTPFTFSDRGFISLVDANDIVIDFNKPYIDVLKLSLDGLGVVYVSETITEIEAQLSGAAGGGSVHAPEFVVGVGIAAGNIVTLPASIPDTATILMFVIGGVAQNNIDIPLDTTPKTYDFTAVGGLVAPQVVKIIYE